MASTRRPAARHSSPRLQNFCSTRRAREASQVARASAVVRYRTYRIGELPDIQISLKDVIAPMVALVHHDPLIAKLMFAQLFASIREARMAYSESAEKQLHDGVVSLLGSERGGPAFVACLHELALSEKSLDWMP